MIILLIASISGIAIIAGTAVLVTAAAFRPEGFEPSSIEGRLAQALPGGSRTVSDSAFERREYDWTVEYDDPIGSQRIVITQNPASFGEEAAVEAARTTAMLYRGTTIEVWAQRRSTGERVRIDGVRMESRRVA